LVRHGHFVVNGIKTDIPSFLVSPGDQIVVQDRSRSATYFKERSQVMSASNLPTWLSVDIAAMTGSVLNGPTREEIAVPLNEQLIVEYYSR